jgi:hypothetical protein
VSPGERPDLVTGGSLAGQAIKIRGVVVACALRHEVHLPWIHVIGDDENEIGLATGKYRVGEKDCPHGG